MLILQIAAEALSAVAFILLLGWLFSAPPSSNKILDGLGGPES